MTVTPYPQSVVVPVELLAPIAAMWREASCHDLAPADDKHAWGFNRADLYWGDIRKLAEAAAPAPSSLAGGEVLKALLDYIDIQTCTHESIKRGGAIWTICEDCGRKWADDEGGFKPHVDAPAVAAAREYLAALSPEAPARVGVSGADMLTMTCFANNHDNPKAWAAWSRIRAALTPRHEAPADLCKSCNGTGRELGSRFNRCLECWTEAPAEGAGEDDLTLRGLATLISGYARDRDREGLPQTAETLRHAALVIDHYRELRARSSAPEARS